jgi:glycine/D-amino acid oxidase-like deaminating enzyme
MAGDYPFQQVSAWAKNPPTDITPLNGDIRTDVVIIGAGFTGLNAALALRAQGANVVVLEKDFAGAGASGRNVGHLSAIIGKDLTTLLTIYGKKRGSLLVQFGDAAVRHTEEIIKQYSIDCDYVPNGNIITAMYPAQAERLRQAVASAQSIGARVRYLTGDELRERNVPPLWRLGGMHLELGGVLNPFAYTMGLRRAAIAAGVKICEQSALERLEDGAPLRAYTANGIVTASHAVLATNSYTPQIGWKTRSVVPIMVSLFETGFINPERFENWWTGREGLFTFHNQMEAYRLTAHGTLMGGIRTVTYTYDSQLGDPNNPRHFGEIARGMHMRFPELGDLKFESFWSGWVAFTMDFLPLIGKTGKHKNVHYCIGYNGHGVSLSSLMASMVAEHVMGRETEFDKTFERHTPDWPPEPTRSIAARGAMKAFAMLDGNEDKNILKYQQNQKE